MGARMLLMVAVVAAPVAADCLVYGPVNVLFSETGVTTVRVADVDGDGDLDVLGANRTGGPDEMGSISIFANLGDGLFAEPEHIPLINGDDHPRSMALADFDGNGAVDLVTANWFSHTLTLLLNDGTGAFIQSSIPVAAAPTAVAVTDVDGDQLPDIAVSTGSATAGGVVIYRNLGEALFEVTGMFIVFPEPRAVTSADLDGDEDLDLVIACRTANALAILLNDGGGSYAPAVEIPVGVKPRDTTAGDFDGDGDLDLAVAMYADPDFDGECWILRNDGNGAFAVDAVLGAGKAPHAVSHGDLDGDCDIDVVVANVGTNLQTVWLNDGTGQFLWRQDPQTSNVSADVWLADLDGDDMVDIVAAHPTGLPEGDRLSVLLNLTEPVEAGCPAPIASWTNVVDCSMAEGDSRGAAWGDYNKDGLVDVYVTNWGEPNRLYRNLGGQLFAEMASSAVQPPGDSLSGRAVWGDCDNDGDLDIYLAQNLDSHLILKNGGSFALATNGEPLSMATQHARAPSWGDYDQDGLIDLYVASSTGANRLLHNEGEGVFADASDAVTGDTGIGRDVAWADYDNDGDQDLYLASGDSAGGSLDPEDRTNRLFRNDGPGSFTDVASGSLLAQTHSRGVAWGDYDNDGDLDLYVAAVPVGGLNGENMLLRNDGGDSFTNVSTGLLGYAGATSSCSWIDHDNDGDLDLFLVNLFEPNLLLRNDGAGTFVDVASGPLRGGADETNAAAWADYDQDGDLDSFLACGPGAGNALVRNDLDTGNHWLAIRLAGTRSNRSGIGARLTLTTGKTIQIREIQSGSGYLAQHELAAHFGLGTTTSVDSLTVRWPSGEIQIIEDLDADQHLTVIEPCEPGVDCADCNGNGVADVTDLIEGTSQDFNSNGLPDECELPDANGDGIVDVTDLLEVIIQWGPCPALPRSCTADFDDSGVVDVADLIAVIVLWS